MQYLSDSNAGPIGVAVAAVTAAAGIGATYWLARSDGPTETMADEVLAKQSIDIGGGVRRSILSPDNESFVPGEDREVTTLFEVFEKGIKRSDNGPCLGSRTGPNLEYEWMSYSEMWDRAHALGSWMSARGIGSGENGIVAIYGSNSEEWVITEYACYAFNRVPVALYDTLGPGTTKFILKQTEVALVVCDTSEKVQGILKDVKEFPELKHFLVMRDLGDLDVKAIESEHGITVTLFSEAIKLGKESLVKRTPPKGEDLATIMYTSGTTGDPKGVMLTHSNVVCSVLAICFLVEQSNQGYRSDDVHLSYLPLAHIFERMVQATMFLHGAKVGFSRGDIRILFEDLQALKPTIFPTVPRLLNKIYDKVQSGLQESRIKSALFSWAMAAKEKQLKKHTVRRDTLWDKLVFRKIQDLFGGRVRVVVTGSAPLSDAVITFYRCALGCMVSEGYGQTESCGALTFTVPEEITGGHVGPPIPVNHIKLVDVPESGYFADNSQGEICGRGLNIFKGYYKNEERTKEALDEDGWLHTGDIGQWMPNGTLKIIDRKKNIFKLSQGEYVAPEKVEVVFSRSKFVAQCFVEGDSLQPYLMCVVVPDEEVLVSWASKKGMSGNFAELCKDPKVKDAILEDINAVGRSDGLKGFELAKDVHLCSDAFSVENGLLTPTFKNKRNSLRKHFAGVIQNMYHKHRFSRQQSIS